MMDTTKRMVLVAADILLWALVAWLILSPPDAMVKAKAAWHTTKACWAIASWFGRWAMVAELRYNQEMESR